MFRVQNLAKLDDEFPSKMLPFGRNWPCEDYSLTNNQLTGLQQQQIESQLNLAQKNWDFLVGFFLRP